MRWILIGWVALAFLTVWLWQVAAPEPDTWRALAGDPGLCFFEKNLRTFANEPWLVLRRGLRWGFLHNVDSSFGTLPLVSVLIASLTLWLLILGIKGRRSGTGMTLMTVYAMICIFHPSYAASWMLGDRFHLFVVGLGAIAALYAITRWRNAWGVGTAMLVALLASFTTHNALAVWAAGLVALVPIVAVKTNPESNRASPQAFTEPSGSNGSWRPFLIWLFLSQIVFAGVFLDSHGLASRTPSLVALRGSGLDLPFQESAVEGWEHHLQWLGLGLPLPNPEAPWRRWVGLSLVVLGLIQLLWFGSRVWRRQAISTHHVWAMGCTLAGFVLLWLSALRGYPVLSADAAFWEAAPAAWLLGFGVCALPLAAQEAAWRYVLLAVFILGIAVGSVLAVPHCRLRHRVLKGAVAATRYEPLLGRHLIDVHPRLFGVRALPYLNRYGIGEHLRPGVQDLQSVLLRTDGPGGRLRWLKPGRARFECPQGHDGGFDLACVVRWRGEAAGLVGVLRPAPLNARQWEGPLPRVSAFRDGDVLRVIGLDAEGKASAVSRAWLKQNGTFVEQGGR